MNTYRIYRHNRDFMTGQPIGGGRYMGSPRTTIPYEYSIEEAREIASRIGFCRIEGTDGFTEEYGNT